MKKVLTCILFLLSLFSFTDTDRESGINASTTKLANDRNVIQSSWLEEITNSLSNKPALGKELKDCLEQCLTEQDSSKCISEVVGKMNTKMNGTYLLILKGEEVIGYEEHLTALNEVRNAQAAWLKFKELELYLVCNTIENYETVKFDTTYPREEILSDWCADQSNMGMRNCAKKRIAYYDSLINLRQATVHQLLGKKDKVDFEKSHLSWLVYRESQASIHQKIIETFSGSMYPTSALVDEERVVRQRAKELERYLTLLNRD